MKSILKKIKTRLDAPVPLLYRRLGSALVAVGALEFTTETLAAFPMLHKTIVVSAMIGAFITNFAKEKTNEK